MNKEGSPPHVREGPTAFICSLNPRRITPACAGRTGSDLNFSDHIRDHPRVCGKDNSCVGIFGTPEGSPPRVREGPRNSGKRGRPPRITPACAGRTLHKLRPVSLYRDHPRVCGKDFIKCLKQITLTGSPPRVREGLYSKQ